MSEPELAVKLMSSRPLILWAEMGGLLHDIGKLSNAFYDYRRKWRNIPNGWNRDPHDHQFLSEYDKLIKHPEFKKLCEYLQKPLSQLCPNAKSIFPDAENCSFATFVELHTASNDSIDSLTRLLKAADGKDAALDRNNPLFTADQTEDTIFDTDVFGSEYGRQFSVTDVDAKRQDLYNELREVVQRYLEHYTYDQREEILNKIRCKFTIAFSDTTRPDNDTSLWEHCYAVASLFKALVAHKVIYGKDLDDFAAVHFGILGVGWDGLAFLSQGEKIGDITGRVPILHKLKYYIRQLIEYDFPLGNTIYEDNDGIYFLVPRVSKEVSLEKENPQKEHAYQQLLAEIKSTIKDVVVDWTHGDICPNFYMVPDTKFMTQITRCIKKVSAESVFPLSGIGDFTREKLQESWPDAKKTVCPVCLRRPVISEQRRICETCDGRRIRFYGKDREIQEIEKMQESELKEGTHFISEIVQASGRNKRAALIVAKFDLRQWLNGRMERSLFITEARGLEKEVADLGNTRSFGKDERGAREWLEHYSQGNLVRTGYDYHRIIKEVDQCYNFDKLTSDQEKGYARNTTFLYDRRIIYDKSEKQNILNRSPEKVKDAWDEWRQDTLEEYEGQVEDSTVLLLNILCAKTPTPSTVLDVWNTTKGFFEGLAKEEDGKILDIGIQKRFKAQITKPEGGVNIGQAYEGKATVKNREENIEEVRDVDVVWLNDKDNTALIINLPYSEIEQPQLTLDGKPWGMGDVAVDPITGPEPYEYRPMRIITTSPDLFMAIVPADQALDITSRIYREYLKRFGKVMGRLPLSIGNIFFEEHTPMFVVLDSARRMVKNFEKLGGQSVEIRVSKDHCFKTEVVHGEERIVIKLDQVRQVGCSPTERSFDWVLPYKLGTGETDYYHPYFMVKKEGEENRRYSYRKNYFRTVVGDVIHFTEVQPGDILKVYPNYYDFEFLDATTRRYDLNLEKGRRKSNVTGFFSKPYLLDDLGLIFENTVATTCPALALASQVNQVNADSERTEGNKTASTNPGKQTGMGLITLWHRFKETGNKALMPGLTDTRLRNIESLWFTKLSEWKVNSDKRDSPEFKQWTDLVEATLKKEFPARYGDLTKPENREDFEFLKEAIFSGLFFDCLELHLRILKNRIREEV